MLFLLPKDNTIESIFSPIANLSIFCSLLSFAKFCLLIKPFCSSANFTKIPLSEVSIISQVTNESFGYFVFIFFYRIFS